MAGAFDSAPEDHWASLGTSLDVLGDREHHRWEDRCRAQAVLAGAPWPGPEARALVEAILGSLASNDSQPVVTAARAWAHTSPSVSTLVRQMGVLREVLSADDVCAFPGLDDRLVRIMDQATTTATAAALTELEDAALTDALTGVGNRRALETAAIAALASADRSDLVVSIVVIDLDGLKSINDTDGHAAGDRAIAGLTESLRAALRDTDQMFRIGGDEFVALLPFAPIDTVTELMSRARECDAPAFSWGAATAPEDGTDLETLLARADERLYEWRRTTRGTGRPGTLLRAVPALAAHRDDALGARADGTFVGASLARRRRRVRHIRVVGAVLVLSALLGVALHFLVKSHSGRPSHVPGHNGSQHSPTPGTPGSVTARTPGAPPSSSNAGSGTATHGGGTPTGGAGIGGGSTTGSPAGQASGSGTAANGTGSNPTPGTSGTTTTVPTVTALLPGSVGGLSNVGPPPTSLP